MASLAGVEAWSVGDRLEEGPYIVKPSAAERTTSSNSNPQVQVDWRVQKGTYKGAEQRDWVTFTESAVGRVVQLLQACDIEIPQEDFKSYDAMADWVAEQLKKEPVCEMVIRLAPSRKDPSKEWPEVAGYRRPSKSDLDNDASSFASAPGVSGATCKQDGCSDPSVADGYCAKHKTPF